MAIGSGNIASQQASKVLLKIACCNFCITVKIKYRAREAQKRRSMHYWHKFSCRYSSMGSSALTILQPQAHHLLCFCDLLSHFSCHCIAKRTKNKTKMRPVLDHTLTLVFFYLYLFEMFYTKWNLNRNYKFYSCSGEKLKLKDIWSLSGASAIPPFRLFP